MISTNTIYSYIRSIIECSKGEDNPRQYFVNNYVEMIDTYYECRCDPITLANKAQNVIDAKNENGFNTKKFIWQLVSLSLEYLRDAGYQISEEAQQQKMFNQNPE